MENTIIRSSPISTDTINWRDSQPPTTMTTLYEQRPIPSPPPPPNTAPTPPTLLLLNLQLLPSLSSSHYCQPKRQSHVRQYPRKLYKWHHRETSPVSGQVMLCHRDWTRKEERLCSPWYRRTLLQWPSIYVGKTYLLTLIQPRFWNNIWRVSSTIWTNIYSCSNTSRRNCWE